MTDGSLDETSKTHEADTTTAHGAVSAATASKFVVRDASARAKFAAAAAAGDAAIFEQVKRFPPIAEGKTVWAALSYIYEWDKGVLHSNTTAYYEAFFVAPWAGSFKIVYAFMSNTSTRDDHFHIYAGKSAASGAISLTNCLNNEQAQFNSVTKDIIYQYATGSFSLNAGDVLTSSLRKQDNTGTGYLILVGCWLEAQ